jgi:hypothetical protein
MKFVMVMTAAAMLSANAQTMKNPASAAMAAKTGATVVTEKISVPLPILTALEKELDGRLSATGASENDPCYVLGGSRAVFVSGLGVVVTSDVDLVNSPGGPALFQTTVGTPQKAAVRKRKLAHVAMLQQTMREMISSIAASPYLKLTDTDQVVVAVRLMYRSWEDTTGLPGQIVARMERRGGPIAMEVQ